LKEAAGNGSEAAGFRSSTIDFTSGADTPSWPHPRAPSAIRCFAWIAWNAANQTAEAQMPEK
ncbi:MAG: hypothetical protein WB420_02685, partial [Bradyrhizobium sp.]